MEENGYIWRDGRGGREPACPRLYCLRCKSITITGTGRDCGLGLPVRKEIVSREPDEWPACSLFELRHEREGWSIPTRSQAAIIDMVFGEGDTE